MSSFMISRVDSQDSLLEDISEGVCENSASTKDYEGEEKELLEKIKKADHSNYRAREILKSQLEYANEQNSYLRSLLIQNGLDSNGNPIDDFEPKNRVIATSAFDIDPKIVEERSGESSSLFSFGTSEKTSSSSTITTSPSSKESKSTDISFSTFSSKSSSKNSKSTNDSISTNSSPQSKSSTQVTFGSSTFSTPSEKSESRLVNAQVQSTPQKTDSLSNLSTDSASGLSYSTKTSSFSTISEVEMKQAESQVNIQEKKSNGTFSSSTKDSLSLSPSKEYSTFTSLSNDSSLMTPTKDSATITPTKDESSTFTLTKSSTSFTPTKEKSSVHDTKEEENNQSSDDESLSTTKCDSLISPAKVSPIKRKKVSKRDEGYGSSFLNSSSSSYSNSSDSSEEEEKRKPKHKSRAKKHKREESESDDEEEIIKRANEILKKRKVGHSEEKESNKNRSRKSSSKHRKSHRKPIKESGSSEESSSSYESEPSFLQSSSSYENYSESESKSESESYSESESSYESDDSFSSTLSSYKSKTKKSSPKNVKEPKKHKTIKPNEKQIFYPRKTSYPTKRTPVVPTETRKAHPSKAFEPTKVYTRKPNEEMPYQRSKSDSKPRKTSSRNEDVRYNAVSRPHEDFQQQNPQQHCNSAPSSPNAVLDNFEMFAKMKMDEMDMIVSRLSKTVERRSRKPDLFERNLQIVRDMLKTFNIPKNEKNLVLSFIRNSHYDYLRKCSCFGWSAACKLIDYTLEQMRNH